MKVIQQHLYTMTRDLAFTYEKYYILLVDIEAIMNSRPLTPMSSDPSDLLVLTPAISSLATQPAQLNLTEVQDNRLSRWQHLQKIHQRFWRRWQFLST